MTAVLVPGVVAMLAFIAGYALGVFRGIRHERENSVAKEPRK